MIDKALTGYLIKRYLRFDRTQPFITISAILAFVGVMVGVMVLILSMAIMNGTQKAFEERLFTMNYPLTIFPLVMDSVNEDLLERLEKKFPDLKYSPYLTAQAIIRNGDNMSGGVLFGIDLEREKAINSVVEEAMANKEFKKYDILLGEGLLDELNLYDGSKAMLIFTQNQPTGLAMVPKMKRFNVVSHFNSGLSAYDKAYMYTTIEAVQNINRTEKGIYDGIHIYTDDAFSSIEEIRAELSSDVKIVGWWEQNGNFFAAMTMEKRALFIVLMLIVLVASLNIISSLLMTVMNRRKEIALLLSMGATTEEIKRVFFLLGVVIGGAGVVFGVIFGFLGIWVLGSFDIVSLPADVYGSSKLPLDLSMVDFISILVGSVFIVAFSSFYPARQASKVDVLQVLRNE